MANDHMATKETKTLASRVLDRWMNYVPHGEGKHLQVDVIVVQIYQILSLLMYRLSTIDFWIITVHYNTIQHTAQ